MNFYKFLQISILTACLFLSGCITIEVTEKEAEKVMATEQKLLLPPKDGLKIKGYITDWLICGPCINNDDGTRLSFDYLSGEAQSKPRVEEPVENWKWKKFRIVEPLNGDNLNSTDAFGTQNNCVIYAFIYLYSTIDQNVSLLAGSDDGLAVWVNSEKVWFNDVPRGMKPDEDVIAVKLKTGYNRVMLKISQSTGGYGFCARFADKDGKDIEGLLAVFNNPGL